MCNLLLRCGQDIVICELLSSVGDLLLGCGFIGCRLFLTALTFVRRADRIVGRDVDRFVLRFVIKPVGSVVVELIGGLGDSLVVKPIGSLDVKPIDIFTLNPIARPVSNINKVGICSTTCSDIPGIVFSKRAIFWQYDSPIAFSIVASDIIAWNIIACNNFTFSIVASGILTFLNYFNFRLPTFLSDGLGF
jgi:hypothetical protein